MPTPVGEGPNASSSIPYNFLLCKRIIWGHAYVSTKLNPVCFGGAESTINSPEKEKLVGIVGIHDTQLIANFVFWG